MKFSHASQQRKNQNEMACCTYSPGKACNRLASWCDGQVTHRQADSRVQWKVPSVQTSKCGPFPLGFRFCTVLCVMASFVGLMG